MRPDTAHGSSLGKPHRQPLAGLLVMLEQERDRWFLWTPVLLGVGIALYFSLPFEPALAAALLPLVLALALLGSWRRSALSQVLAPAAFAIAAGSACAKLSSELSQAPVIERKLYRAVVEGFVERIEPRTSRGPRVTLRVIRLARLTAARTPYRVRIRFMKPAPDLRPGDAVRLHATLAPPSRPALPGGYDFARTAYFQRLGAVGYAHGAPEAATDKRVAPLDLQVYAALQRLRQTIGRRVAAALPGETGAIADALMTGERGRISKATLSAYRDAGLLHILSISGLHMAIIGGALFFGLRLVLAAVPPIALRYPIKKWAAACAIATSFAYLLISGTTHATIRAFIMISIMMLAILLDRPAIALRNVALAALLILVVSPASLLHVGFQMSFAAVVGLVAAYEAVRDRRRGDAPGLRRGTIMLGAWFVFGVIGSTIIASLAVAPIAAFHFHKTQQYGVLANLIAVPLCNFLVLPAALMAFIAMPFGLEIVPLWLMGKGIDLMTWTAGRVAGLPGAVGRVPAFSMWAFAAIVSGGLWLCLWRRRWRLWGLSAIALGLLAAPLRERPDILVGRDGRLVAVRQPDGRLTALRSRGAKFELDRWLEHDGDARSGAQASDRKAYRCDTAGCVTQLKAQTVAISRNPASLADDCRRSTILILSYPQPRGCNPQGAVIDFWALRRHGTHAVYLTDGMKPRVISVHALSGIRPWSRTTRRLRRQRRRRSAEKGSRVGAFAARRPLIGSDESQWRPEIEDSDPDLWRD